MSLVNVLLKFQFQISEIHQYFLLTKNIGVFEILALKSFSHFFNISITVFCYKVIKHLAS